MQVTSLLHQQSDTNCPQPEAAPNLTLALVGFIAIANAYLVDWIWMKGAQVAALSALAGAILLGLPLLLNSFQSLRRGEVGINELVSLAFLASFCSGDYRTAGLVAFFMILGEVLESRTAAGARAAIESLLRLAPARARRLSEDGSEAEVAASELRPDDRIRIRPGDSIPADGVILAGTTAINQAHLTGESLPVDRAIGDEVFAGSSNLTGVLEVRVLRAGEDTTLGKVRELILAAEQTKLPISRLIDQYVGYYTPLVVVLAALVWAFTHDLNRVIATLVVSCPCAFVLATPTAMVAALAAASRLGILVKNVADLELAGRITAFVFDKTGTITTGRLTVSRLQPVGTLSPAELLLLAASAEKFSTHPTARALQQLAEEANLSVPDPENFSETAGRGVAATVQGRQIRIGRATWLRELGVTGTAESITDLSETDGYSLIHIADGQTCIGWIALNDRVRSESAAVVTELQAAGIRRTALVSGDRRSVAERVAGEVQFDAFAADCLPQDKVAYVQRLKEQGFRVAVVGDGVNDAPALAAGDLGIAMGAAGSEVAIQSASIALLNSDLRRLPFLVQLSRNARSTINQNFVIGLLFIVGGLVLAMLGKINPVIAAILHNAGSLLVVFNSARLVRQGEHMEAFESGSTAAAAGVPAQASPIPA
jgi:Cd2+/Zn2+-exporting ATPase